MADPTLTAAFEALQQAGFPALVWDLRARVVGITSESQRIFRSGAAELDLPLGGHMFSADWVTLMERVPGGTTLASMRDALATVAPALLRAYDGDRAALRADVDPRLHDLLEGIEPAPLEPMFAQRAEANFGDRTIPFDVLVIALRDTSGREVGGATISKPGVGGAALAMLATGDSALFERMLRLLQPARRASAFLFADLVSSAALAHRLSTRAYFTFVRRLTERADRSVLRAGGIAGKHSGDGITAFFLAEDAGSESGAARACIETAQALRHDAAEAAERSGLDPAHAVFRVGLHWGTSAYIGRLLTSGRTEVTALGDEVNEAARIEACASAGHVLASKPLIERLDEADARDMGIDPDQVAYTPLGDLPGAPEKVRRDAPVLSVTRL